MRRIAALLLAVFLAVSLTACSEKSAEKQVFAMDTVMQFTAYGKDREAAVKEAEAEMYRLEGLLSRTREDSEVSQLNSAGGVVPISEEVYRLIGRAMDFTTATGGAFDITIAPVASAWGFTEDTFQVPGQEELEDLLAYVGPQHIRRNDQPYDDGTYAVELDRGTQIDLGGIAKGYIADRLAEMVRGRVSGATLNFGGNVYALGNAPGAEGFNIGIAHPQSPNSAIAAIRVLDRSVVTSGTYQRCFEKDGRLYHHILDPSTGLPADTGLVSASIVAESSMTADALATACIVLGEDRALALLQSLGYDGLLIREDMTIVTTPGLKDRYPLQTAGQAT